MDKRAFAGLKVVDATHVLAGPYCGFLLALMGAKTIKIEAPDMPDPVRGRGPVSELNDAGLGLNYLLQNSNKRALSLDLKTPDGLEVFKKLAKDADVVIENFRSGAFEKLDLGYETIKAINPRVIYCSITAFGGTGPMATRNGYDPVLQGMSGIAHSTGANAKGFPTKSAAPMIDYGVGLAAAFAISSALYQREKTGQGQQIDCSMFELALVMMGPAAVHAAYSGEKIQQPPEAGTDIYRAKDTFLQLGAYNFRQNRRMWDELGNAEFASYNSWPEIWDNAPRMRTELEKILPTKTADEWEQIFSNIGVPAGRVRNLQESVNFEQVKARGFMHTLPEMAGIKNVRVPVAPFTMAHGGPQITSAPPRHGEHSVAILRELGYSPQDIERMQRMHVI